MHQLHHTINGGRTNPCCLSCWTCCACCTASSCDVCEALLQLSERHSTVPTAQQHTLRSQLLGRLTVLLPHGTLGAEGEGVPAARLVRRAGNCLRSAAVRLVCRSCSLLVACFCIWGCLQQRHLLVNRRTGSCLIIQCMDLLATVHADLYHDLCSGCPVKAGQDARPRSRGASKLEMRSRHV